MNYQYVKPDRRFFGPRHWGHQIHLYVDEDRIPELWDFLDTVVGFNNWRLSSPMTEVQPIDRKVGFRKSMRRNFAPTRVKFLTKDHAVRMKLMWAACEPPPGYSPFGLNKVILPLIRRVMPTLIANDILGVQPMTAPSSSIFAMRSRHA